MKREFLLAGSAIAAMLIAAGPALAAACSSAGAKPVMVGTVEPLAADAPGKFSVDLAAGQGVLVDLTTTALDKGEDEGTAAPTPGALGVCTANGALLSPLPSEVFKNGGALSADADGLHLRFVAPAAGRYLIAAAPAAGPRELLLRTRDLPRTDRKVTDLEMGGSDFAKVSNEAPLVYSFPGRAGQWVKITATSENDTVLHLAAPTGGGAYEVIADNDDSDGLNPVIRRRLPATGTYYVQVESITSDANDMTVLVQPTDAPPPPPPPAALKAGTVINGKLENAEDKLLFALPVQAGHAYRLEATAPYDVVVEVGVDNPMLDEDSETGNGFSSVKSQDAGTTGTEKLNFTARATGRVLVQVRAYGLGDSDGSFKLTAVDAGM